MKQIQNIGAQGDVMFLRAAEVPADAVRVEDAGPIVVAHSDTGHHHAIACDDSPRAVYYRTADPLVCYLQVTAEYADVVHHRPWDTHETVRLLGGGTVYEVRRQREYTPQGLRRIED